MIHLLRLSPSLFGIFRIFGIFILLLSPTFVASMDDVASLDTVVLTGSGPLCAAVPSSVTSQQDLRAKIRAVPEVCSVHEGFFHLVARTITVDDYSCSETKPCSNGACCAKTGYCNYGPEACGTDGKSPNDKCWSNCDAHAPCGNNSISGDVKCPLNVCCSQFGFCGATADFCGQGTWWTLVPGGVMF